MNEEKLDLVEVIGFLRRNIFILVVVPLLFAATAVLVATFLPKRFRSIAVLNIQASYFQNPLVSDLIAQVTDAQELQSQRMSLLRLALNQQFLDRLGEHYGIYKSGPADRARVRERELLLQRIEYFSLSPTNFQISVSAPTADMAQAITADVLQRMKETLIQERWTNLTRTRNALQGHVKNIGSALQQVTVPAKATALNDELSKVEGTLRGLLTKFSDSHPEVVALRSKLRGLQAQMDVVKPARAEPISAADKANLPFEIGEISAQPTREIFNELIKKLSYLSVVLDMERDRQNVSYLGVIEQPTLPTAPTFPKRSIFAGGGLALGMLVAGLWAFLREVRRGSYITPYELAEMLETPLLGELPPFTLEEPARRDLRGDKDDSSDQRRLPAAS